MAVLSLGDPFKLLQGLDVFRKVFDVVGVIVDIARLEEGFEFESGTKPQETARLICRQLAPAIPRNGQGFDRLSRGSGCCVKSLGSSTVICI